MFEWIVHGSPSRCLHLSSDQGFSCVVSSPEMSTLVRLLFQVGRQRRMMIRWVEFFSASAADGSSARANGTGGNEGMTISLTPPVLFLDDPTTFRCC